MSDSAIHFVLCVDNEGYPAALERHKIYQALDDTDADQHGLLRVVDESGDDYLYPASFFIPIAVPEAAEKALLGTG